MDTYSPPVSTVTSLKSLEWTMRVVAFSCLLLQATFVLFDASWKRTSWLYTTAGVILAMIIHSWAAWRLKKEHGKGTPRPLVDRQLS